MIRFPVRYFSEIVLIFVNYTTLLSNKIIWKNYAVKFTEISKINIKKFNRTDIDELYIVNWMLFHKMF